MSFLEDKAALFVDMVHMAQRVADIVIVIGPGGSRLWELSPSWDALADCARNMLNGCGVTHYGGELFFSRWVKRPNDAYHAAACKDNEVSFGRYLAHLVLYAVDAYSVRQACYAASCSPQDGQSLFGPDEAITVEHFFHGGPVEPSQPATSLPDRWAAAEQAPDAD